MFHIGAALNAKGNKGIWVFVAPPIWLFHPEWFNEKGNKYRRISGYMWGAMIFVAPLSMSI